MKAVKSGMIEVRNLLALYVVIIMLPIAVGIFTYCANFKFDFQEINDEIALYKLRKTYLLSYNQEINNDSIVFMYNDKYFELSNSNNHLILKPGSQIYLEDIDRISFFEENGCIMLEYQRGNKTYEKVIGSKERLHIDDFSCDDDSVPELDDSVLVSSE